MTDDVFKFSSGVSYQTGEIFLSREAGLTKEGIFQPDIIPDVERVCPNPSLVWCRGFHPGTATAVWFRLACRRWTCPVCGPKKARLLSWRGEYGANELVAAGLPLEFVTVTSHEALDPAGSLAVLPKAWNKLNRRLKRETGRSVPYFAVPEQHEDGRWHLHAIVGADLLKRWWKDNARECGMGYMSDAGEIRRARSVARYVAKYQAKLLTQSANLPSHFRRVRASHNYPVLPALPQPEGWDFEAYAAYPEKERAEMLDVRWGRAVIETDHDTAWKVVEAISGRKSGY